MLFDSHAHLNDESFDEDRDELIESLPKNGVDLVVNPASDLETSRTGIQLADKYDFIYAAVGIHPQDVAETEEADIQEIKKMAQENKKVVAIGEIGLDYYYDDVPKDIQRKWLKRQILLANELSLPIIIHDRDAHKDTFDIIKENKSEEIGCVMHCFSGSVELAKEYLKLGCYISIPGTVTFKNSRKVRAVAREIPLDKLLIETDSPYLTPEPYRGKRNNPAHVRYVAERVAEERGISFEEVCDASKANAKKLFRIEE
ncbi:MAG: TatD family hydrolase [Clostridioides sp.]|jgi:TatD DNase family protein|nr:TatD family hydrolase [Clostridioides sp.]